MSAQPEIRAFFDEPTNTVTYLVWDRETRKGVAIDPVLDFDPASGLVDDESVEELLKAAEDQGITIEWVLETHIHADHLSGAPLTGLNKPDPLTLLNAGGWDGQLGVGGGHVY